MSGKTAKKLRALARKYTTNYVSYPFWTERGVLLGAVVGSVVTILLIFGGKQ